MCDKLVYDLAQEVEGSPSVFIRKDWINILDNQNQNYISNQSVLDTSQLSNSNKWMSYREAYFSVPMMITVASLDCTANQNIASVTTPLFTPANDTSPSDSCVGLKNWFGNIIHSFTLDYNGTTIIQQTPFVNMWNSFKLMTSLSYQDIITQGTTIGFYPDTAETFEFYSQYGYDGTTATSRLMTPVATGGTEMNISGTGACNNTYILSTPTIEKFQNFNSGGGNEGFSERIKWIAFDTQGVAGFESPTTASTYGSLLGGDIGQAVTATTGQQSLNYLWKSYIIKKQNQAGTITTQTAAGLIQYAITATIYLKHIHSFFNMIPLLKGVFMKMTMNLNNCSSTVTVGQNGVAVTGTLGPIATTTKFAICNSVQSALGGANMLMLSSPSEASASNMCTGTITATAGGAYCFAKPYRLNLSVGGVCLDNLIQNLPNSPAIPSPLSKSIYLYIPAYTFNPTFEQAYLSSPVKQIKYTDIYQYQVLNVAGNGGFVNNLLTNGIANVKSVLILPFYSSTTTNVTPTPMPSAAQVILSSNTGFTSGLPVWQSPFDPAGCGATSPLCHFTNFNVQVSGQNAIYNLQKYGFEQFNNQLYGQNAVNGGLTDGITSSLINRQSFDLEYCYYYVNIERMLPVEQSVPKSIQLVGQNLSSRALDLICFIEYGTEVNIDSLTGSRV